MELDSSNNRAVIVDTGSPARPIGTSECEQLTNYKPPRCLGIKIFGEGWAKCKQRNNCNRMPPDDHIVLPWVAEESPVAAVQASGKEPHRQHYSKLAKMTRQVRRLPCVVQTSS